MKYISLFILTIASLHTEAQVTSTLEQESDSLDKADLLMIDMPSYSISYPEGWKIREGCIQEQCTIISPTDTIGGYDTYLESINLTVNELSNASYTAEKYANYSEEYLPQVVTQFRVLNKAKLSENSHRLIYTGVKNNIRQVWRQFYHVKDGKVYIITFSVQQKKYKYYKGMIKPYLTSFKFK